MWVGSTTLELFLTPCRRTVNIDESTLGSCLSRPRRLAWPRTSPFHGGNTGSNPVGDANIIKDLLETPFFRGDTAGTHNFQPVFFSPSRSIATTFPWAMRLAGVTACAYTS